MVDSDPDLSRIAWDTNAFEDFYRKHVELVQRFIARRVDDPYLVADLTADVFLAAIESARSYRASKGVPMAWLYGVARNVIANERRRAARRFAATRRINGRALANADDIAAMDERIDAEAKSRELYLAMDRLSHKERAVLELVALEGLTVNAAAEALGIRPGTARVRYHRARKTMQHNISAATEQNMLTEVPS